MGIWMPQFTAHMRTSLSKLRQSLIAVRPDAHETDRAVPLTHAATGAALRVVRVIGCENCEVQRLCEMGMTTGCRLLLLRSASEGASLLVQIGECRLCLDSRVARNFWVA